MTGQVEKTVKGFSGRISSMTFNPDSTSLLTVFEGGIMTWPLFDFLEPDSLVTDEETKLAPPATSPDGRWVASIRLQDKPSASSEDNAETVSHQQLLLQDRRGSNGSRILPMQDSVDGIRTSDLLKFSDDGTILASLTFDPQAEPKQATELKICNTDSGRELLSVRAPASFSWLPFKEMESRLLGYLRRVANCIFTVNGTTPEMTFLSFPRSSAARNRYRTPTGRLFFTLGWCADSGPVGVRSHCCDPSKSCLLAMPCLRHEKLMLHCDLP